ncbi:MAG TPA: ribonuclease H-like domain-containing protein [Bdellovibrionales bacterium]|nr:ribonuclease H-like domain-containing protein [Bdellovibrionales bacterium]
MIENSFVHLPGIGHDTEARFWSSGVRDWNDLEQNLGTLFGHAKAVKIARALQECRAARESGELSYFQARLKGADMWRLIPDFFSNGRRDEIAYLDIETTGLGFPPACASTTIAVLFKGKLEVEHVHERKRLLMHELERDAKLLVTFNGSTFDLPFLRREFKVDLRQPHVDMRYWLARLGRRGGLKKIQATFHDVPQRDYMDIDGFDAVRLWNLHRRAVPNALETLMTYNAEDTLVLEHLVHRCLTLEARRFPALELPEFAAPSTRAIPYEVCPHVYRMLRGPRV